MTATEWKSMKADAASKFRSKDFVGAEQVFTSALSSLRAECGDEKRYGRDIAVVSIITEL